MACVLWICDASVSMNEWAGIFSKLREMAFKLSQSCHVESILLLLWRTSAVYGNYWHCSLEDLALLSGRPFSTAAVVLSSWMTWLTTPTVGSRTRWLSPIMNESLAARSKSCACLWNCGALRDYTKSRNLMGMLMDSAADWKPHL